MLPHLRSSSAFGLRESEDASIDIATLGLRIEGGQAVSAVDALTGKLQNLESVGSRVASTIRGFAAATGLTLLGAKLLKETIDAQDAMAQLENAVKSTGGAAGLTVKQLDDLSVSLQGVSTYSDEAIKNAETMFTVFNKIKGDTFARATKDAVDFATRTGDLSSAAQMLGKALEDPSAALTMLQRQYRLFTESEADAIKSMADSGHQAEAQNAILSRMEERFGGAAAAARGTLGGALKGLGHDFGDLFERTQDQTSGTVSFINKVDELVKSIGPAIEHVRQFSTEIKTLAEVAIGAALVGALARAIPLLREFAFLSGITGSIEAAKVAGTGLSGVLVGLTGSLRALIVMKTETLLFMTGIGPAFAAAAVAGTGFMGVIAGLKPVLMGFLAGPFVAIAALASAGALAIYDLNKAFEEHDDKLEEASKNTKEYVEYLKALGHAHSQAGGAGQLAPSTSADDAQTKRLKDFLAETQTQIDKQRALNAGYMGSAEALAILGAQMDGAIAKAKAHKDAKQTEWAAIDQVIDALTRENVAAARNAAQKQNTEASAALAATNAAMVQGAKDADTLATAQLAVAQAQIVLAGTSTLDSQAHDKAAASVGVASANLEHLRISLAAAAQMTAADVEYQKALVGATKEQAAWAAKQLNDTYRAIAAETALKDATVDRTAAAEEANRVIKEQIDFTAGVSKTVTETVRGLNGLKAWMDGFLRDEREAQEKYQKDLQDIWRDGIGKITTDGFKSFHDFFEDVFQLFSKLITRMEAEGKDSGFGFGALKLGGAAIAGGQTGYAIGQQSPSSGSGAFNGALGGAATGFMTAGPWGALVGGLAGLTGGLLGGAEAAKKRREAEDALRESLTSSLNQMRVLADTADPLTQSLLDNAAAFRKLRDENDAAYAGLKNQDEREKNLAEINGLEAIRIQQLKDEADAIKKAEDERKRIYNQQTQEDATVRILRARGDEDDARALERKYAEQREIQTAIDNGASDATIAVLVLAQALEDAADAAARAAAAAEKNAQAQQGYLLRTLNATGQSDLAFALQQQIELNEAIKSGLDAVSIALLKQAQAAEAGQREVQQQTTAINAQLQTAQSQLQAAEQSLAALQQIHDSLAAFGQSLKVGQYSPLSPAAQLAESRRQLIAQYNAALGGDQQAASNFPSIAQSFLQASRGYNASGAGYVMDFNSVSVMTDALTRSFGDQMTDQQMMIEKLKEQIDLLQRQLDALNSIDDGVHGLLDIGKGGNGTTTGDKGLPRIDPSNPGKPTGPAPVIPKRPALGPTTGIGSSDISPIVAVLQAGFVAAIASTDAVAAQQEETNRRLRNLEAKIA